MDDAALLEGFDAVTLQAFPHEDHVRTVFLQLRAHDRSSALAAVRTGIQRMAERNGNPGAYHETRTVAWFRLIADAATRSTAANSHEFLAENPQFARRDLLDDYYAEGALLDPRARTEFVEPSRAPLPD